MALRHWGFAATLAAGSAALGLPAWAAEKQPDAEVTPAYQGTIGGAEDQGQNRASETAPKPEPSATGITIIGPDDQALPVMIVPRGTEVPADALPKLEPAQTAEPTATEPTPPPAAEPAPPVAAEEPAPPAVAEPAASQPVEPFPAPTAPAPEPSLAAPTPQPEPEPMPAPAVVEEPATAPEPAVAAPAPQPAAEPVAPAAAAEPAKAVAAPVQAQPAAPQPATPQPAAPPPAEPSVRASVAPSAPVPQPAPPKTKPEPRSVYLGPALLGATAVPPRPPRRTRLPQQPAPVAAAPTPTPQPATTAPAVSTAAGTGQPSTVTTGGDSAVPRRPALPGGGAPTIAGLSDYVEAPTDPTVNDGSVARGRDSIDVEVLAPLTPETIGTGDSARSLEPPTQATSAAALAALHDSEAVPHDAPPKPKRAPARAALTPPAAAALPRLDGPDVTTTPQRSLRSALEDLLEPEAVVARVNDEEITWRALLQSSESLPEDYQDRLESVFPALLQRLIDLKLLAQAARDEGLEDREDVRQRVRAFEDALLREALLREMLKDRVSDSMLREAYNQYRAEAGQQMQAKVRHIQVASRQEAVEVIAALQAGESFAQLARDRSLGSSASRGGDLGTVDVNRMVPGFAEALASQPVGQISKEPVQSEFGWHVILVEERLGTRTPAMQEMAPQLRRAMAREVIEQRLTELREEADIEVVQPDVEAPPRASASE